MELYPSIKEFLVENFQIPEDKIVLNADLADDLDLDSIDLFDIMVHLEKKFDRGFTPDDFKGVKSLEEFIGRLETIIVNE